MRARQILLLLVLGIAPIPSRRQSPRIACSGSGDWQRSIIGDGGIHVLGGGPLLDGLGCAFVALTALLDRLVKMSHWARYLVVAVLALATAFESYFPLRVLFLVGAAF